MKNFYITTAIDYANGSPHLGHAYEKVLTDVIARCRRMKGERVHFLTGLDEHGQKVQQSARKAGIAPIEMCDAQAEKFQNLCKILNISNDDYIRTSQPRHKKVVAEILQKLYDKGEIYKAEYKGFYSTRQEQFLQEKEKNVNSNVYTFIKILLSQCKSKHFCKRIYISTNSFLLVVISVVIYFCWQ